MWSDCGSAFFYYFFYLVFFGRNSRLDCIKRLNVRNFNLKTFKTKISPKNKIFSWKTIIIIESCFNPRIFELRLLHMFQSTFSKPLLFFITHNFPFFSKYFVFSFSKLHFRLCYYAQIFLQNSAIFSTKFPVLEKSKHFTIHLSFILKLFYCFNEIKSIGYETSNILT